MKKHVRQHTKVLNIIVIDALDECGTSDQKNKLLACIKDNFMLLPKWLSFFLTGRPETAIREELVDFNPFHFEAKGKHNMKDIKLVFRDMINDHLQDLKETDRCWCNWKACFSKTDSADKKKHFW